MAFDPRHKSRVLLDGPDRAAARAYFRAIGFTDEDLARPQVGVAHSWIGAMPCNFNHRDLAAKVAAGIRDAGGTPIEFNTIAVTDGIAMGTEGMKASLVSRDLHRGLGRAGGPRPHARWAGHAFPAATRPSPPWSWPWPASTYRPSCSTAARSTTAS